ncbi:hypothetical protein BC941DRAFT_408885 [Chlamydoabsidia padenii]|nr:hypothetical protein BC941DRAFT_408885 [Chlamydoabsidia padenii]
MFANPMRGIPPNFITEWVMMICPVGKRCLVTSGNGQTVARARNGRIISRFQSSVPSGCIYCTNGPTSSYCILDCILDTSVGIFYVLDVMCWNGQSLYELHTNSRHHFMQTQIQFTNSLREYNMQFKLLIPVSLVNLQQVTMDLKGYLGNYQPSMTYNVDGLLFYHRRTEYVGGNTDLVRWLSLDKLDQLHSWLSG